ncbi:MAG: methyltransferase domain-containing protein [Rubrivivax sp.]|nr:methyltransferase domain-containing protein [Rubrivivax sp.]
MSTALRPPPAAEREFQQALAHYQREDFSATRTALQRCLRRDPRDVSAINLLAAVEHRVGRTAQAVALLRPWALRSPLLALNLAMMLLDGGRTDEADAHLRAALQLFDDDVELLRQWCRVHVRRRDHEALYACYRLIRRRAPLDAAEQANLWVCLERIQARAPDREREADIRAYLEQEAHGPDEIRELIGAHLALHLMPWRDDPPALLQQATEDRFLLDMLQAATISHPGLEDIAVRLRRALLACALQRGSLAPPQQALASALAVQNQLNEQVQARGDDETVAAAELACQCGAELALPDPATDALAPLLLLVAMYEDLARMPWVEDFLRVPPDRWPQGVQTVRRGVQQGLALQVRAKAMPCIGSIDDPLSRAVQDQYEANPYPRWHRCKRLPDGTLPAYLRRILPPGALAAGPVSDAASGGQARSLRVLSAGCGTGKEPIELARSFPECDILAIDLSTHSLAYAQAQAESLGLRNIRFAQADILQLGSWSERFDLILSSGVLHHLQDTEGAWALLRKRLAPGGIMHVALYSRLARQGVQQVRDFIAREGVAPDVAGIRAIRALSFEGRLPGFAGSIDFYATSGCRDLLFHVHEQSFEPAELAPMLQRLQLRFLGFDVLPERLPDFDAHFPDAAAQQDLQRWQRYEQEHPQTFARMLSFWCQGSDPSTGNLSPAWERAQHR